MKKTVKFNSLSGIRVTNPSEDGFRFRVSQSPEHFDIIVDDCGEFRGYKSGSANVNQFLDAYGYKPGDDVSVVRVGMGIVRVKKKAGIKEVIPLREFNPDWINLDPPAYKHGKPVDNFDPIEIKLGDTIKWYRGADFEAMVSLGFAKTARRH